MLLVVFRLSQLFVHGNAQMQAALQDVLVAANVGKRERALFAQVASYHADMSLMHTAAMLPFYGCPKVSSYSLTPCSHNHAASVQPRTYQGSRQTKDNT